VLDRDVGNAWLMRYGLSKSSARQYWSTLLIESLRHAKATSATDRGAGVYIQSRQSPGFGD
jgi:hypothetical protein